MIKESTYIGYWWFQENSENEFQGVLNFETNGDVVLNVLDESKNVDFNQLFRSKKEIPTIIGLAKDRVTNKEFSFKLIDAYVVSSSSSFNRLKSFSIKSYSVLKSQSNDFSSDLEFDVLILKTDLLDDWLNIYGHKFSVNEGIPNFNLSYKQPDEITLFQSEDFSLKAYFSVSHSLIFSKKIDVEQSACLNLYFTAPKKLQELKPYIRMIRDFFSLAVGLPINITKTVFSKIVEGENKPDINFELYQKSKYESRIPTFLETKRMLITYNLIKDSPNEVFANWFKKYDALKFLMNNYFGSLYNEFKYVEDKFLDFIFSIEVYHRAKFGGFDLKDESYLKIRDRVLSSVKDNSDKQWLEARLKKYTENTLQSRLRNILELNKESLSGLIENNELFLKKIVETRHYHVHSSIKNDEYIIKNAIELSRINKKLEITIQAILLSELGFKQDVINKRLRKNSPFTFN
ncbi:hypothetical protein F6U93_05120 [Tamlana haliotis]|uniref:Uncharacterized protein n=1 Tax=Pseudotamlana haliotis TaxID=2614804 RepID=A0A6N6MJV9_9FLAO|nr:HEPN domain-containing protein [Tamlana haliotis]KAB1069135.1 hypothetical protein F6U93_05120 [Tamlana haliotis]